MIAETLLACWLIASIYLPLLHALTRTPPIEVRRVTNALVVQRAHLLAISEPAVVFIPTSAVEHWRASGGALPTISVLSRVTPKAA